VRGAPSAKVKSFLEPGPAREKKGERVTDYHSPYPKREDCPKESHSFTETLERERGQTDVLPKKEGRPGVEEGRSNFPKNRTEAGNKNKSEKIRCQNVSRQGEEKPEHTKKNRSG